MTFKTKYDYIVYCKNDYYKEFDNNVFYKNENIQYYKGYLLHCEDGPAVQWTDSYGINEWFINGHQYSEKEYMERKNLKSKSRVLDEV